MRGENRELIDILAEEYFVDPAQFSHALHEQRQMKLKGGLYHLNQVLFAYNSNRIESSSLDAVRAPSLTNATNSA